MANLMRSEEQRTIVDTATKLASQTSRNKFTTFHYYNIKSWIKAKCHYASWLEAGRRPAASWNFA